MPQPVDIQVSFSSILLRFINKSNTWLAKITNINKYHRF